jgi:hypothetical protein
MRWEAAYPLVMFDVTEEDTPRRRIRSLGCRGQ